MNKKIFILIIAVIANGILFSQNYNSLSYISKDMIEIDGEQYCRYSESYVLRNYLLINLRPTSYNVIDSMSGSHVTKSSPLSTDILYEVSNSVGLKSGLIHQLNVGSDEINVVLDSDSNTYTIVNNNINKTIISSLFMAYANNEVVTLNIYSGKKGITELTNSVILVRQEFNRYSGASHYRTFDGYTLSLNPGDLVEITHQKYKVIESSAEDINIIKNIIFPQY